MTTFSEQAKVTMDVLSSKKKVRDFIKSEDLGVHELDKLLKRITSVRDEIQEKEEREQLEIQEKRERIEQAKKDLEEKGLSLDDVISWENGNGVKRSKKQGRSSAGKSRHNPMGLYEYQDAEGNTQQIEMKALGRLPADVKDYLDRTGKKKKDILVREIEESESA